MSVLGFAPAEECSLDASFALDFELSHQLCKVLLSVTAESAEQSVEHLSFDGGRVIAMIGGRSSLVRGRDIYDLRNSSLTLTGPKVPDDLTPEHFRTFVAFSLRCAETIEQGIQFGVAPPDTHEAIRKMERRMRGES